MASCENEPPAVPTTLHHPPPPPADPNASLHSPPPPSKPTSCGIRVMEMATIHMHQYNSDSEREKYTETIERLRGEFDERIAYYGYLKERRMKVVEGKNDSDGGDGLDDLEWFNLDQKVQRKGTVLKEALGKTEVGEITLKEALDLVTFLNGFDACLSNTNTAKAQIQLRKQTSKPVLVPVEPPKVEPAPTVAPLERISTSRDPQPVPPHRLSPPARVAVVKAPINTMANNRHADVVQESPVTPQGTVCCPLRLSRYSAGKKGKVVRGPNSMPKAKIQSRRFTQGSFRRNSGAGTTNKPKIQATLPVNASLESESHCVLDGRGSSEQLKQPASNVPESVAAKPSTPIEAKDVSGDNIPSTSGGSCSVDPPSADGGAGMVSPVGANGRRTPRSKNPLGRITEEDSDTEEIIRSEPPSSQPPQPHGPSDVPTKALQSPLMNTILPAQVSSQKPVHDRSESLLYWLLQDHSEEDEEEIPPFYRGKDRKALFRLMVCLWAEPIVGTGPFDREWTRLVRDREMRRWSEKEDGVGEVSALAVLVLMSLMGAGIGLGPMGATQLAHGFAERSSSSSIPPRPPLVSKQVVHYGVVDLGSISMNADGGVSPPPPKPLQRKSPAVPVPSSKFPSGSKRSMCPVCKRTGDLSTDCACSMSLLQGLGVFAPTIPESVLQLGSPGRSSSSEKSKSKSKSKSGHFHHDDERHEVKSINCKQRPSRRERGLNERNGNSSGGSSMVTAMESRLNLSSCISSPPPPRPPSGIIRKRSDISTRKSVSFVSFGAGGSDDGGGGRGDGEQSQDTGDDSTATTTTTTTTTTTEPDSSTTTGSMVSAASRIDSWSWRIDEAGKIVRRNHGGRERKKGTSEATVEGLGADGRPPRRISADEYRYSPTFIPWPETPIGAMAEPDVVMGRGAVAEERVPLLREEGGVGELAGKKERTLLDVGLVLKAAAVQLEEDEMRRKGRYRERGRDGDRERESRDSLPLSLRFSDDWCGE